jgi:hypothetical protein
MSEGTEFITIIRPSFMRFSKDACRAATFNHILFRIAGKCKDQPKGRIQSGEITWYAKTEQIREEMSNAWGVCKIRQEVNALIDMGIVGRSNNPNWGADRTKHFAFGTDQCTKFLDLCEEHNICVVHLGLSPEVTHLIYLSNANDRSIKCTCQIESNTPGQMIDSSDASINISNGMIDLSNANDESIGAIPIEIPTIDDYKERESNVIDTANADVITTSQSSSEKEISLPAETKPQVTLFPDQLSAQPAKETARRRSPAAGKSKRTKKDDIQSLLTESEIPAPKKPDPTTHPYNAELFMELADYYRGCPLPVSTDPRSRYMKAVLAARNIVQRKIPFEQVDKMFCFLLGRGAEIGKPGLKDEKWIAGGYNTDLWTVESNFASKWLDCVNMEKILSGVSGSSKSSKPAGQTFYAATILHENAQRDIRRLDPDYVADPNEDEMLSPGELEAYMRAFGE